MRSPLFLAPYESCGVVQTSYRPFQPIAAFFEAVQSWFNSLGMRIPTQAIRVPFLVNAPGIAWYYPEAQSTGRWSH
jgi:hypothetical protein